MIKIKKLIRITSCLFLLLSTSAFTQQRYQSATVAFYNVENLFDTIVSAAYIDGTRSPDDPMYYRSIPKSEIDRSEEHTSELQSRENIVCRLLLEKKK